MKAFHLLLPVLENGLDLAFLIVGELQRLIQPLQFLIGSHPMSWPHMLPAWGLWSLLPISPNPTQGRT